MRLGTGRPPRGQILLGTQGFAFDDWVGPFYPPGTAKAAYLEEYARHFQTVEIDSTFYGSPRPAVVQGWFERTPPGFLVSAKFPKEITHEAKLAGAEAAALEFVQTMQVLGEKLGVLTLQFAYDFGPENLGRLERFLRELPQGPRYAVEIRNRRWLNPELTRALSALGVAFVLQDLPYMPRMSWITAGFTVVRWLGRRSDIEKYDRIQIDRTRLLREWAERCGRFIEAGIDLYGYFNNHFAGHSPASVRQFSGLLAESIARQRPPEERPGGEEFPLTESGPEA